MNLMETGGMSWEERPDPAIDPTIGDSAQAPSTPTVLCIDDDPNVCRALARTLRSHGVEVLVAYHGMHGYHLAATMVPDLIITDLRMPQGEGCYLIECLKRDRQTAHIPVVVFSGVRDPGIESKVRDLGAVEFFNKPTPIDTLLDEVRKHIDLA
jgi:response regulator RpfG family c-di-GMP phosphodiesterase